MPAVVDVMGWDYVPLQTRTVPTWAMCFAFNGLSAAVQVPQAFFEAVNV